MLCLYLLLCESLRQTPRLLDFRQLRAEAHDRPLQKVLVSLPYHSCLSRPPQALRKACFGRYECSDSFLERKWCLVQAMQHPVGHSGVLGSFHRSIPAQDSNVAKTQDIADHRTDSIKRTLCVVYRNGNDNRCVLSMRCDVQKGVTNCTARGVSGARQS